MSWLQHFMGVQLQPARAAARIQQHTLPEPPKFVPAALTAGPRGSLGEETEQPARLLGIDYGAGESAAVFGCMENGVLFVTAQRMCPQPQRCSALGVCQGKC